MSENIKPVVCPVCGAEPIVGPLYTNRNDTFNVYCPSDSDLEGERVLLHHQLAVMRNTEAEAIAEWNRRFGCLDSSIKVVISEVERLQEAGGHHLFYPWELSELLSLLDALTHPQTQTPAKGDTQAGAHDKGMIGQENSESQDRGQGEDSR